MVLFNMCPSCSSAPLNLATRAHCCSPHLLHYHELASFYRDRHCNPDLGHKCRTLSAPTLAAHGPAFPGYLRGFCLAGTGKVGMQAAQSFVLAMYWPWKTKTVNRRLCWRCQHCDLLQALRSGNLATQTCDQTKLVNADQAHQCRVGSARLEVFPSTLLRNY